MTREEFSNYRLVAEFRWGLLTWGERRNHTKDSGILLHVTSLPSRCGIGDLGDGAYRFVDFLAASSQQSRFQSPRLFVPPGSCRATPT